MGDDELSNALTNRWRLKVKPRAEPSNVRICLVDILTFNGFFDSESDILKPRWLLTAGSTGRGFGTAVVAFTVLHFGLRHFAKSRSRFEKLPV